MNASPLPLTDNLLCALLGPCSDPTALSAALAVVVALAALAIGSVIFHMGKPTSPRESGESGIRSDEPGKTL